VLSSLNSLEEKMQNDIFVPLSPSRSQKDLAVSFPRKFRNYFGGSLEYLWDLSRSIRIYKVQAIILQGTEKYSGRIMNCFYLGHRENFAFIFGLVYSNFSIKERYEDISSLKAEKWIKKFQDKVDLLVVDLELIYSKFLAKHNFMEIPPWVHQKLFIHDEWNAVLNKFRKNTKKTDIRKVRKYNFSCRITRNEDDFRKFYHNIYRPYLEIRFKDAAIIEPEWKVMRQCKKGELMQIMRGDVMVAGVVLHAFEKRLAYVWAGVPENIDSEICKGAFSAIYYFTIIYGFNKGCNEIDFLASRPLLNDGVFRYKRKWGTEVKNSQIPRGDILLKPLCFGQPVVSFLTHNHFVVRDGINLIGKILSDRKPLGEKDIEHIHEYYSTEGLDHIKVFSMAGFDEKAKIRAEDTSLKIKLVDLSSASSPHKIFCR
jgi:hypothetical protein